MTSTYQEQALRHLELLGIEKGSKVYLRAIHSDTGKQGVKLDYTYPRVGWEKLKSLQDKGYSLYVVVNDGGQNDDSITAARAIFVEHDDLAIELQKELWQQLGLPEPTLQVFTGGKSIHSYWVFDQPHTDIKAWKQLQTDLLAHADGDKSIKNPSRVMRLAGSRYCKGDNPDAMAEIITQSGHRYSFDELRKAVPAPQQPKPKAPRPKPDPPQRVTLSQLLTRTHQKKLMDGVKDKSRNTSGAALIRDLIGVERRAPQLGIQVDGTARDLLWEFGSRCNPPLDDAELEKIYKSGEKSDPSPCLDDDRLLKIASKLDPKSAPSTSGAKKRRKPKATDEDGSDEKESHDAFRQIMEIVKAEAECWINSDDTPYADVVINGIRKTFPIEGRHFKRWLATRMFEKHEKGLGSEPIEKVGNVLCGMASSKGPQRESHLRIAEHEGSIYIDMADERWQVLHVSKQGWRVIQSVDCPVRFVRAASQLPLPMPEQGGDISQLWRLLPVAPDSRPLLLGWLISCFTTTGAKPILVFSGPKGSGKSEAATTLKMLTDPGKAAMMPSVGDSRNMASAAMSRWVMIYDNLTHLNVEQQDVLCRASTGAGFSHRSLFTDLDETFTEYKRPQILTSVDLVPSRSDLLDRCVLVQLERIPEAYRIPIHNLESVRAEAVPKLLGSLLSALVVGLQRVDSLHLERLPRMADFALMVTACEPGLGLQDGEFMRAYQANIETAVETAVECNPISASILALMEDCSQWQGSTQDLLDRMKQKSTSTKVAKLNDVWLARNLSSLKADLDAVGIDVDSHKAMGGRKHWIIRKVDSSSKVQKIPSLPSLPSGTAQGKDLRHEGKHEGKNEAENTLSLPSSLKPAQDKACEGNEGKEGKNETLEKACVDDIDPYPVGCWIEFSRTGSKPKRAEVIPRPVDWTGSNEVGVFVLDVDGHPLLVPINRIRKRVEGMG